MSHKPISKRSDDRLAASLGRLSLTQNQTFHERASDVVANVASDFRQMELKYKEVCAKLGENARYVDPGYLFGSLCDFVNEWKVFNKTIFHFELLVY